MKLSATHLRTLAAIASKELAVGGDTDESKGQVHVEDAEQLVILGLAKMVFGDHHIFVHITAAGRAALNESVS